MVDCCTDSMKTRVPSSMLDMLCGVFTNEEVDQALSQTHPMKSPGPDGFGMCFYKKHWATWGRR